ncbi:MAG: gamma-glutamyltransferase [Desulfobulbaceae bacterium]|nr:gamma-glutamyltransferase [Desulfobulbaceae bacterium]
MSRGKAIVAAGHPLVCNAAMEIMEAGGNCFDAVVAAGLTGALAEPGLTSLGGGGFLLAHPCNGETILYDFFSDTPGRGLTEQELEPHFFPITVKFPSCDQIFNIGMGSVAVPGNLLGYLHVHEKLGRLSLRKILQPVIKLARDGIRLKQQQAYVLNLLYPIMTLNVEGRKIYAPNGSLLQHGDMFHNYDFANFLEQLADGRSRGFYDGPLAEKIAEDMHDRQGLLTLKDLREYRVIERRPLEASYRGVRVFTNPSPSFGGSLIALTLQLLEQQDFTKLQWGTNDHVKGLAKTLIKTDELREAGMNFNPDVPIKARLQNGRTFSRGTTHVSIVDHDGNVASMTTSNGEGSGYIVPGTGIMLNNMMGEDDLHPEGFHACQPGQRVASMMSPSVVLDQAGAIQLVIGSGGSKRIRTAIVQVLSNIFDFKLNLNQAINSPRIHWDGKTIHMEPGYSQSAVTTLDKLVPLTPWTIQDIYFGGVHALIPGKGGVGDPRRGGTAMTSN